MNKTIQTMQKAVIAISILVFCSVLSFNCNAQDGNKIEDFINVYIEYKKQYEPKFTYHIYPKTLTDCAAELLSMNYLRENRKPWMGEYNPYDSSDTISIANYLSDDDLEYLREQLQQIESIKINPKKLSSKIKLLRTKETFEKVMPKFVKKKYLYHFSVPIFSRDTSIALVYNNFHALQYESGVLILFQKKENHWKLLAFVESWSRYSDFGLPPKRNFLKRIFTSKRRKN